MTDARSVGSERLVLVAGLHRSGTTALARVLAGHPEVSGFNGTPAKEDEGQHLQDVYPAARANGGAGQFAFAAGSHLTEASPLATAANAQRLLAQWAPYWDLDRRYLLGEVASQPAHDAVPPGAVPASIVHRGRPSPGGRLALDAAMGRADRAPLPAARALADRARDRSWPMRLSCGDSTSSSTSTWWATRPGRSRACARSSTSTVTYPSTASTAPVATATCAEWQQLTARGSLLARLRAARMQQRFGDRVAAFGYRLDDLDHVDAFPSVGQGVSPTRAADPS